MKGALLILLFLLLVVNTSVFINARVPPLLSPSSAPSISWPTPTVAAPAGSSPQGTIFIEFLLLIFISTAFLPISFLGFVCFAFLYRCVQSKLDFVKFCPFFFKIAVLASSFFLAKVVNFARGGCNCFDLWHLFSCACFENGFT